MKLFTTNTPPFTLFPLSGCRIRTRSTSYAPPPNTHPHTWMTGSCCGSGKCPLRPQHSMSIDRMRRGAMRDHSPVGHRVHTRRQTHKGVVEALKALTKMYKPDRHSGPFLLIKRRSDAVGSMGYYEAVAGRLVAAIGAAVVLISLPASQVRCNSTPLARI